MGAHKDIEVKWMAIKRQLGALRVIYSVQASKKLSLLRLKNHQVKQKK